LHTCNSGCYPYDESYVFVCQRTYVEFEYYRIFAFHFDNAEKPSVHSLLQMHVLGVECINLLILCISVIPIIPLIAWPWTCNITFVRNLNMLKCIILSPLLESFI
jgi:hypothetical protein